MAGMRVDIQDVAAMPGQSDKVRRPFDEPKPQSRDGLAAGNSKPSEIFAGRHFAFHPRTKFSDLLLHDLVVREADVQKHPAPLFAD
jgi:hypothetical protein